MSNDYTLPPPPDHPYADTLWSVKESNSIKDYGHACAEHARAPLLDQLGQCFRISGSDPDSNETWRLAPRAVEAVRQLRADYDEACDECEKLRARIAELEADVSRQGSKIDYLLEQRQGLVGAIDDRDARIDRLRAELAAKDGEVEKLRADAERYRAWRHAFREGECGFYNAICRADSASEHDAAIDAAIAAQRGEGE